MYMYLFCFFKKSQSDKKPGLLDKVGLTKSTSLNKKQIQAIQSTFEEYEWDMGFAVEETIANDISNDKLLIQFVSPKKFKEIQFGHDTEDDLNSNLYTRIVGKEQFISNIYFNIGEDVMNNGEIRGFFVNLGEASAERQINSENVYEIDFDKYGGLRVSTLTLEEIIAL